MIYNHSNHDNAEFYVEDNILVFKASRFIRKGEEIFIHYGINWFKQRNLTVKEVPSRIGLINPLTLSLSRMVLLTGTLYGGFLLMVHYHKSWIELMTSFNIGAIALP